MAIGPTPTCTQGYVDSICTSFLMLLCVIILFYAARRRMLVLVAGRRRWDWRRRKHSDRCVARADLIGRTSQRSALCISGQPYASREVPRRASRVIL
jgi:hypothetical protein